MTSSARSSTRARWLAILFLMGTGLLTTFLITSSLAEEETVTLDYLAVNHTAHSVVSFTINGEGGVLNSPPFGGGGKTVCCVTLPAKWRPGLKVTIRWENDGDWLMDEQGREVIRDGKRVYVPLPPKERTVELAPYTAHDLQHFDVHFMPGDEVIAKPSYYYPWHPEYQPRYPRANQEGPP
jgi:hypothetical protein